MGSGKITDKQIRTGKQDIALVTLMLLPGTAQTIENAETV